MTVAKCSIAMWRVCLGQIINVSLLVKVSVLLCNSEFSVTGIQGALHLNFKKAQIQRICLLLCIVF